MRIRAFGGLSPEKIDSMNMNFCTVVENTYEATERV